MAKQIDRRALLKGAAALGGTFGVAVGFNNCAPVSLSGSSNSASSCGGGNRTANTEITDIDGLPVLPMVPGTNDSLTATYAEALHRSQANGNANNSQKLLIVAAGPDPGAGNYAPIAFAAGTSLTGISEILLYVKGTPLPIYRRVFHAGDVIPETMFIIDPAFAALEPKVSLVLKNETTGFWKTEIELRSPVAYKDLVKPFAANTPFGGSTFERPYVSGAGLASGGQGDLGALHMPRFDVTGNNIDVRLGIDVAHPRIGENHYVAGCGIYDQNGHPIGPVFTIMYGTNYPDFSIAHFKNLRLAERGASLIRTVVFDTYNGYLMGFHKL